MKTLKIIGAILTLVIALAWINRTLHPKPLDEQALPSFGVGQVLAEEAARALKDNGRVVLVNMPLGSVECKSQLEGFQKTLRRHAHVSLIGTRNFDVAETPAGRISFPQMAAVMKDYPNADVIVSFLPVTSITDAQLATLPKPAPKLIVKDWNRDDINRGMNAGLVVAAVSTRRLTSLPSDHPKTPRQWFDRYYDLVLAP